MYIIRITRSLNLKSIPVQNINIIKAELADLSWSLKLRTARVNLLSLYHHLRLLLNCETIS